MAVAAAERKKFFKRLGGKEEFRKFEMNFFDHIIDLRWHLVRSVVAWLIAATLIFMFIDYVYDNIILAPAKETFLLTEPCVSLANGFTWATHFVCLRSKSTFR